MTVTSGQLRPTNPPPQLGCTGKCPLERIRMHSCNRTEINQRVLEYALVCIDVCWCAFGLDPACAGFRVQLVRKDLKDGQWGGAKIYSVIIICITTFIIKFIFILIVFIIIIIWKRLRKDMRDVHCGQNIRFILWRSQHNHSQHSTYTAQPHKNNNQPHKPEHNHSKHIQQSKNLFSPPSAWARSTITMIMCLLHTHDPGHWALGNTYYACSCLQCLLWYPTRHIQNMQEPSCKLSKINGQDANGVAFWPLIVS